MKRQGGILFCALVARALMPCGLAGAETLETPRSGRIYFGFAGTSITPDRPVAIGGQYHTRISGEVHDPLSATALAIETRDAAGIIDQRGCSSMRESAAFWPSVAWRFMVARSATSMP